MSVMRDVIEQYGALSYERLRYAQWRASKEALTALAAELPTRLYDYGALIDSGIAIQIMGLPVNLDRSADSIVLDDLSPQHIVEMMQP
jgi:hypothetical protein